MKVGALRNFAARALLRLGFRLPRKEPSTILSFGIEGDEDAQQGRVAELFFGHQGRSVHKWVQYLEPYDRHFASFRTKPVRMLEIGIQSGGSLELWRRYFGADAVIYGIDIDPSTARNVDPPNQVRIGSQADPEFLLKVLDEMGGVDIVLDDGSHIGSHQLVSLNVLFPLLSDGGLYVLEDLHTAYWREWHGGYRRPGTAIEILKSLLDDMHHHYHPVGDRSGFGSRIKGIHAYDSIAFIEKSEPPEIGHTIRPKQQAS